MAYTLEDFKHLLSEVEKDLKGAKVVKVIKACSFGSYVWHGRFVLKLDNGRFAYLYGGISESDYYDYAGIRFSYVLERLYPPIRKVDFLRELADMRGDEHLVQVEGDVGNPEERIEWDDHPDDLNQWLSEEEAEKPPRQ